MVGQAERLGRPRDVPLVLLERVEHDLPLGLRLERLECAGRGGGSVASSRSSPRTSGGMSAVLMTGSSDAINMRSRQLRSSRTLFFRQS